jgi:putative DNA methylase
MTVAYRKKLVEVALPLPEINDASAYDKMPGIGPHPKGIHHWWARLPLPTARAILFASVVDDPSEHPERFPTEEAQNAERERLFGIVRSLMTKKMHEQPKVYAAAHLEMLRHCDGRLPVVFDPFAGGGSIPLEAQRLGFGVHASDLNPVAVLINKALLEIGPKWADCPPINPLTRKNNLLDDSWQGTKGLAEDVRYYAKRVFDRAQPLLAPFYPSGPGGQSEPRVWKCPCAAHPLAEYREEKSQGHLARTCCGSAAKRMAFPPCQNEADALVNCWTARCDMHSDGHAYPAGVHPR